MSGIFPEIIAKGLPKEMRMSDYSPEEVGHVLAAPQRHAVAHVPEAVKTQEQLLQLHKQLCDTAKAIMQAKNDDYADAENDPFKNFREFGRTGIIVRISDKWARLKNFHNKGSFSVSDEGLKELILDTVNYLILYYAYPEQEKGGDR